MGAGVCVSMNYWAPLARWTSVEEECLLPDLNPLTRLYHREYTKVKIIKWNTEGK